MTSEEYVQQIDRLMNQQNTHFNWILTILGILIAIAAYYQWKISEKDKANIIQKVQKYADDKISESNDGTDKKISNLNKTNQDKIDATEEKFKIVKGSNSNGFWTRFPDGTQICRNTFFLDLSDDFNGSELWEFPAEFIEGDLIVVNEIENNPGVNLISINKRKDGHLFKLEKTSVAIDYNPRIRINFIAIGSWKLELDKQI